MRQSQYQDYISDFSHDVQAVSIWQPIDNPLIEEAADMLEKHSLRAGDALHLAGILRTKRIAEDAIQTVIVVSSDLDLIDAYKDEGLIVLNPEDDRALEQLRGLR